MKWKGRRQSRNIEDRRMQGARRRGGGLQVGGLGLLAILALGYFAGIDVTPLLQQGAGPGSIEKITQADKQAGQFVSVTLADTEKVWAQVFQAQVDGAYRPATLVL